MNLLVETEKNLKMNGKSPKDVLWCGTLQNWFTWDDFANVANVEYDNGYGSNEVVDDLLVVGSDFWLERHEYDGSEWWEFKSMPIKPLEKKIPVSVLNVDYDNEIQWEEHK